MTQVRVAAEGRLDFAVATRLLSDVGLLAVPARLPRGPPYLLRKLAGYAQAAKYEQWLVLLDLDQEQCAPTLLKTWLTAPSTDLTVRVAVREIESWLLADRGLAEHLRVPASALPEAPDLVSAPKRLLVEIVRAHCRTKNVCNAVLPGLGSTSVGPNYNNFLDAFVHGRWDPEAAGERSDSLQRALRAIERLVGH